MCEREEGTRARATEADQSAKVGLFGRLRIGIDGFERSLQRSQQQQCIFKHTYIHMFVRLAHSSAFLSE